MTKIKLCGLTRAYDIEAANELMPEYIGFVFAEKSKRYLSFSGAKALKKMLNPEIKAVGVFVDEEVSTVAKLLNDGIIDIAQLHGGEDDSYIAELRKKTGKNIIKAFKIKSEEDIIKARESSADYVLLDSGTGGGKLFDWSLIKSLTRDYFLAGGLSPDNIARAVAKLKPYAVDVSSGIETDGFKDKKKMAAFTAAVRKENGYDQP